MADPILVLAVLSACAAAAEYLARKTPLRHLGGALLVIVLAAIAANSGLLPAAGSGRPGAAVHDGVFRWVGPLAIFWLLLDVRLSGLRAAGGTMVALFLIGSLGTVLGVVAGLFACGGREAFGEPSAALAGMFTGTYTGGSANFNAVALEYGIVRDGGLYAGAAVVDSALTTVWMAATVALPRLLAPLWRRRARTQAADDGADAVTYELEERVGPEDLGLLFALGLFSLGVSSLGAEALERVLPFEVPSILVLTTLALILAQLPAVARRPGKRLLGMAGVLLFLASIGALCDLASLRGLGELGLRLSGFVLVVVGVHGLCVFGGAWLLRLEPEAAAVASQANIGGGTTALALARSLGRADLALPAILIGSLGSALGTYLGFLVAGWVGGG